LQVACPFATILKRSPDTYCGRKAIRFIFTSVRTSKKQKEKASNIAVHYRGKTIGFLNTIKHKVSDALLHECKGAEQVLLQNADAVTFVAVI